MNPAQRFFGALGTLVLACTIAASASPRIESTPVPAPPKPDWSTMKFLIGTWQCSTMSSRRPAPFKTTMVYTMGPGDYWLTNKQTTHKTSWVPVDIHNTTYYTYDSVTKKWVRLSMGDFGGYAVSTGATISGGRKTYTYALQSGAPDVASNSPDYYTKVSDTSFKMTSSFKEKSGRTVTVNQTCNKS